MLEGLFVLPILLFSVVIHEISHGYMALRLGDPTAKRKGRLTLNPLPHIDAVGSVLVPLMSLIVAGQVFIAWAKPVPVNPLNFQNARRDDILVSIVGPLSNVAIALCCTVIVVILLNLLAVFEPSSPGFVKDGFEFLIRMFYAGILLNSILAVFNLLPIPPLDGSHIVASLLPQEYGERYRRIGFFGIFVIILLMRVPAFKSAFMNFVALLLAPFDSIILTFA
ncbi:MAG: site-2 protease family protein [Bacteroidota bacterium]